MVREDEVMRAALALGDEARRHAPPNPWVGCVLVRDDGVVVGTGASRPPGEAHAEAVALAEAGERARGATAVVTLEPCSHHARTPPCADALVEAGVTRVVVAVCDPDPRVSGRGVDRLRAAGIDVTVGVEARAVTGSLRPYLHHRRTGRAFCLLKSAASLDGRVAAADGTARWITGAEARADAHELRALSQAVVVGSGTALADRPSLTVREVPAPPRPPMRVVLDARGRVPATGPLFDADLAPTLVCTTDAAPEESRDGWRAAGAKVEVLAASTDGGVDLLAMLELLGAEGVLQAMVEGGPTLHGALVAAGLADRWVTYVAPLVLGPDAMPMLAGSVTATLEGAPRLDRIATRSLGEDLRIDWEPVAAAVPEAS